jgi:hypothetical protein
MQFPNENPINDCARLNEFLDGEMTASEGRVFEAHIVQCENCSIEVELHRGIESVPDDIVLPADFSKVIAATAESQVSGLRKRKERTVTLAIVAGLGIAVFIVLGANLRSLISVLTFGVEKTGAFFEVIGTFLLNLVLGIVVIVKVAATQMHLSDAGVLVVFGLGVLLAYFFFSGRIARLRDAKR